jgi:beta-galactosidase
VSDKFGAARPFAGGNVTFKIDGPGIITGDDPFDLEDSGGAAAIWIKTKPKSSGKIDLHATHSTLGTNVVTIKIVSGKSAI